MKAVNTASRWATPIPPLSFTAFVPARCSRYSSSSSIDTNCEKTIAFAAGSSCFISCKASISASIFVDDWNFDSSIRERIAAREYPPPPRRGVAAAASAAAAAAAAEVDGEGGAAGGAEAGGVGGDRLEVRRHALAAEDVAAPRRHRRLGVLEAEAADRAAVAVLRAAGDAGAVGGGLLAALRVQHEVWVVDRLAEAREEVEDVRVVVEQRLGLDVRVELHLRLRVPVEEGGR